MLAIRLEVADLASVRFSYSPMLETVFSLSSWRPNHTNAVYRSWLAETAVRVERLDWPLLRVLRGPKGWVPDFLTPRPTAARPDIDTELEIVRRTAPELVLHDLAGSHGADLPEPLASLAQDPAALAERLADAFAGYWDAVMAPRWPRVTSLLQADITYRSHRIATGGAAALFDDLNPRITWSDGVITLDEPTLDADVEVSGRGLPLLPSLFAHSVAAWIDADQPPSLTYPARGRGTVIGGPASLSSPLDALLGRTRAALLRALGDPSSTTQLAHAFQLTPGAVSQHLSVLHANGLLTRARAGHQVIYMHTDLAAHLVRAHEQIDQGAHLSP